MKTQELKKLIREEVKKALKEVDTSNITLQGFDLQQAYRSKDWDDIQMNLQDELSPKDAKALLKRIQTELLVLEVDLDKANGYNEADEEQLDPYIETPTPIAELSKIDTTWERPLHQRDTNTLHLFQWTITEEQMLST
jgi:hypothetical protein